MYSFWLDESVRDGEFIVIGGFYCRDYVIPSIVYHWREFKVQCGFDEVYELHYQKESPEIKLAIARELARWRPITLVAAAMFEMRPEQNRNVLFTKKHCRSKKRTTRDFYCEGLHYILQRVAEEASLEKWDLVTVICDNPELGEVEYSDRKILLGRHAPYKKYQQWFQKGVGSGPGLKTSMSCLKDLNFQPNLLFSDPSYHDMLQIADCYVGITSKMIQVLNKGIEIEGSWKDPLVDILGLFRNRYGWGPYQCFNDGLIIYPRRDVFKKIEKI